MDARSATPVYHRCTICHRLYKDPKYQPCSHSHCEGCRVKFKEESDLISVKCEASNTSLKTSFSYIPAYGQVGKVAKFTIVTKDDNDQPCYNRSRKVTAQVKPITGDVVLAEVKDNQDSSYTVSFISTQPGGMDVLVFVDGKTVGKHPLFFRVFQHTTLVEPCRLVNDNNIGNPWGVAFGKDGMWAVVNHFYHCVCIFNNHDHLIKKFGSFGCENSQFHYPGGVVFDLLNNLYVVDQYNHRVQKFDINGEYLLQISNQGSCDGQILYPGGITVHNDQVLIADNGNGRISVFQCDGQFSHTFGSGYLKSPHDVTVTDNNQVLVTNWGHHCISIFTIDGNYVNKIGTQGGDMGQLKHPASLCVDLSGFILVTDYGNHRVSIFDRDGVFINCFGSHGSGTGQFSSAHGIACSPNGNVYITDYGNERIQIFSDYINSSI